MKVDPEEKSQPGAGEEQQASTAQFKPRCPNCGWRNVRIAHTKGLLDKLLSSVVSIQRFKCRSCGRYFRHRYRVD